MKLPMADAYRTFIDVGWATPRFGTLASSLVVLLVAFGVMWLSFILSIVETSALNRPLVIGFCGVCAMMFQIWSIMAWIASRKMWCPQACAGVKRCAGATYDGAGGFFSRLRSSIFKGEEDPDWTLCGLRYHPKIANAKIIKVAFMVKCLLKLSSMIVNLVRGYIVETGGDEVTYNNLSFVVMGFSGIMLLDCVGASIFGGERSPCALIGQFAYGLIYRQPIAFEAQDVFVHRAQEIIISLELSPWGLLVPALHEYVYDIRTTSTWLIPLLSDYIALVYTHGAIFHKGCAAAYLIGTAVSCNWLPKPPPKRLKDAIVVKAMSYSLWGPFIELTDETANVIVVVPQSQPPILLFEGGLSGSHLDASRATSHRPPPNLYTKQMPTCMNQN